MTEVVEVVRTERIVIERPGGLEIVEVAFQGPVGRQGDIGPAGATTLSLIATNALGGHRLLTLTAAGELAYASNDSLPDAARIVGLSLNAAAPSGAISIQRSGEVSEPSWAWDVQQPVYLGINGLLTQVPPVFPAAFSLIVGFPMTQTSLFLSLREPITLS